MSNTVSTPKQDLATLLAPERQTGKVAKFARRVALLVAAVIGLGFLALHFRPDHAPVQFETETVQRNTLRVTVSATGTLQPTNKVDIGSELSGLIETVLVRENDHVKKGQVLARLDTSKLNDAIKKSEAALASAQAKLAQALATFKQDSANLDRLQEVSRLSGGKVPSKTEMETAEATLDRARADVQSARSDVNQARANLSTDQTNLSKASIRSPIDGVVLTRSVEPGQTVAATLQVATLFTVAEDLREMELKADVDEADVGVVQQGQLAAFTVDAYSGRQYSARVIRVSYGSQTKDNVVSYSTVLRVRNDDLSLRPGMTATVDITTNVRKNALLVPNAALRYSPATTTDSPKRGLVGTLLPAPPADHSNQAVSQTKGTSQQVWILNNGKPTSVPVTVGATDGKLTEVVARDLKEGMRVITDSTSTSK